jgi:hypothetical protein
MATTTYRGITYTTSSSAGIEVLLDMPLQGGVDQDKTEWLNGNSGGSYPGSLTGFVANNADGSKVQNPRLLVVHVSTMIDNETLTLSGECTEVMHTSCQWAETTAAPGLSQHAAVASLLANGAVNTSTAAIVTDGADATASFSVGDLVFNAAGAAHGKISSITGSGSARTLNLEGNNTVAISDNDALHQRTPLVLKNTSGSTESVTLMMLVR